MKNLFFALIAFFATCCSNSKIKEWKTYEYSEFNFTVDFPYEPDFTTQAFLNSDFTYKLFVSKSPDPGYQFTSYSVFYSDFKNYYNSNDSISVNDFHSYLLELIDSEGMANIKKKEFYYLDYPAYEFYRESPGGEQVHVSRFILVNDKSYQLDLLYPTTKKDDPEHIKFVNSFKLIKN